MMAAVVLGIFYSSVLRVDILFMLQWTIVGSEAHLSLLIVTLDWLYIPLVSLTIDVFSQNKATRRDKIRGHKKDTNQTIKVAPVMTLCFMHYVWETCIQIWATLTCVVHFKWKCLSISAPIKCLQLTFLQTMYMFIFFCVKCTIWAFLHTHHITVTLYVNELTFMPGSERDAGCITPGWRGW